MTTSVLVIAILAAAIAGVITSLLVPLLVRIAEALRAMDTPDGRKTQEQPVPRLGGVAIAIGLALAAGGMAMAEWRQWGAPVGRSELVALAFGTLLVFLVGVVDDLQGVSSWKKLLVELLAAVLMVRVGWSFGVLRLPGFGQLELDWLGPLVSVLWIIGVTNAINLLDGLDGLAGGVVAIISTTILALALLQGNMLTAILMGAIAGACLGFLGHNWAPARIYMGDSGSLTLGFLLAVTSLHSSLKAPAAVAILVPILALGVPVIDTLMVMVVRFLERPKNRFVERFLRVFHADRQHLHHTLSLFVGRRPKIVVAIYVVVAAFCVMSFVVAVTGDFVLGAWLLLGEVAVIFLMRNLGMVVQARDLSANKLAGVRRQYFRGVTTPEPSSARPRAAQGGPRQRL